MQQQQQHQMGTQNIECCGHKELHTDGMLSEHTLEPMVAGLSAATSSPLLALCSDELSLHGARCRTTDVTPPPLIPLYPESGLLLESACADFDWAGSTTSPALPISLAPATGRPTSLSGTGSEDAVAETGSVSGATPG